MKNAGFILLVAIFISCKMPGLATKKHNNLVESILKSDTVLTAFIKKKDALKIQIIYTKIDRDAGNNVSLTDYRYNVNDSDYFYPASTIKMPAALLALEKLNSLNIAGLNSNTLMDAGERSSTNETKLVPLSVAHLIRQIFLISDNNAFNALYEFTGQQYLNEKLVEKGYKNTEIRHRLQLSLSETENRNTNEIHFYDSAGKTVYTQPSLYSKFQFNQRTNQLGKGFYKGGELVNEPFSFSAKNKASLSDLHTMMRAIIFPETVSKAQRFNLTSEDYHLLYRYMSAYPEESKNPVYDTANYYKNYSKFLLFGAAKSEPPPYIRVFNKEGDAYGFLTDVTYIADFKNKTEFFLSATIYCNSDGIFNDDKYDYDDVGFPFLKRLGEAIYKYDLERKRKHIPVLSKFIMNYSVD